MYCTNCGCKLEDDAKFCTNCGSIVNHVELDEVKDLIEPEVNVSDIPEEVKDPMEPETDTCNNPEEEKACDPEDDVSFADIFKAIGSDLKDIIKKTDFKAIGSKIFKFFFSEGILKGLIDIVIDIVIIWVAYQLLFKMHIISEIGGTHRIVFY